jgi:hypothetical protein
MSTYFNNRGVRCNKTGRRHVLPRLACAAAFALGIASFTAARAEVAADYLGGGTENNFPNATGYFFTPTVNVTVSELGYYDHDGAGLAESHDVGIFLASDASTVVTTTIPTGVTNYVAGTVDGTDFEPVSPTVLTGGTEYYIEADNNDIDTFAFGTGAVVYAPEITWDGFGDSASNSIFDTVINNGGLPGNLGPNFIYSVPEPASASLLSVAGLSLLARRRRA